MKTINRFRSATRAKRGGVLALSLVAVGVVAILSLTYLQLSANVTRRQVGAVDTKMSFYLAEAGLAESYSGLMVGHTGSVGTADEPAVFGDGLFWVEATPLAEDMVELEATGMAKTGKAVLNIVVRKGQTNVGALGIFSNTDLVVPNGAHIDGYDSSAGDYEAQAAQNASLIQHARVGSNGNVFVNEAPRGETAILGDVMPGPSFSVHVSGLPQITGETESSAGLVDLGSVLAPPAALGAGLTQGVGAPLVVPAGTFGADFLLLTADSEVILQGPLQLVLEDLSVGPGAELVFDTTNGEVEVFVADALELDPAAVLTTESEDASQVTLNVEGASPVVLDCAGSFYGLVYAPEAAVTVAAGFELFGAVVAETLTLAPGAKLHYDEHLIESGAEEALPKVVSWRIVELPQSSPTNLGGDPFAILGLNPTALPLPYKAHEDQDLEILFLNTLLLPGAYNGPESAFDWAQVRAVLFMKRTGGMLETDLVKVASVGGLLGL